MFSQKDSHNHDEDSSAVRLHRAMVMKNLYSEKVDTNTNIGTWLKRNKNKFASKGGTVINKGGNPINNTNIGSVNRGGSSGQVRTATGCGIGFTDGDLSNWNFQLGYNHSIIFKDICYISSFDPTGSTVPSDIQSKFKIYNRNVSITDDNVYTNYIQSSEFPSMPDYFMRLGNYSFYTNVTYVLADATAVKKYAGAGLCTSPTAMYGQVAEKGEYEFVVGATNLYLEYYYAFVANAYHSGYVAPHFNLRLFDLGVGGSGAPVEIPCFSNLQILSNTLILPGFITQSPPDPGYSIKGWKKNIIDLNAYNGSTIRMVLEVANCSPTGHNAVLYFAAQCVSNPEFTITQNACATNFELTGFTDNYIGETYTWNFGDLTPTAIGNPVTHIYASSGTYTVTATYNYINSTLNETTFATETTPCSVVFTNVITILPGAGDCFPCTDCASFDPESGTYILSAWVKEGAIIDPNKLTYTKPTIKLDFYDGVLSTTSGAITATGNIIDGWQRIEREFTIPPPAITTPLASVSTTITLECVLGDCFFDDIRIYPKVGSMKSYVYDPVNLRLVAELDERNYATMYEYDEEGKLVRVKKETEKGIMTIKENKNSTTKK